MENTLDLNSLRVGDIVDNKGKKARVVVINKTIVLNNKIEIESIDVSLCEIETGTVIILSNTKECPNVLQEL